MKKQQTGDMDKILSFITNLYIVNNKPFSSTSLRKMIEIFMLKNGLSTGLMYDSIESPLYVLKYCPDSNTICISSVGVSPKSVLRNVHVNANIIDLSTYEQVCLKLPLNCPVFTNLKEIHKFIGKSIEQIYDILLYDNQKFFIGTDDSVLEFSNPTTITDFMEKAQSKTDKTETTRAKEDKRQSIANLTEMQYSEVFIKSVNNCCKKILFTDFDGILSSEYIRSSNGNISKTINYGNKTAVDMAHEIGYRVICITSSNNMESVKISKDVCKDCKFDAFYLVRNPELKLEVIQSLAMEYNIPLENCAYIGDDFHDARIFPEIGTAFAPFKSKEILLNEPDMWLYSNQPFLEAVCTIKFSEQYD